MHFNDVLKQKETLTLIISGFYKDVLFTLFKHQYLHKQHSFQ